MDWTILTVYLSSTIKFHRTPPAELKSEIFAPKTDTYILNELYSCTAHINISLQNPIRQIWGARDEYPKIAQYAQYALSGPFLIWMTHICVKAVDYLSRGLLERQ